MDFEEIIEHLPKPIYFSPHPIGNDELLMWAKIKNYKIAPYSTYELLESKVLAFLFIDVIVLFFFVPSKDAVSDKLSITLFKLSLYFAKVEFKLVKLLEDEVRLIILIDSFSVPTVAELVSTV